MRRVPAIITSLVSLSLLAFVAAPTSAQQRGPTPQQLESAILREADLLALEPDLTPAFTLISSGPSGSDTVNYSVEFERRDAAVGDEYLAVVLADAEHVPPEFLARQVVEFNARDSLSISAPEIGSNAVRMILVKVEEGEYVFGDAIAWQHGEVTALVIVISRGHLVSAAGYAEAQQAKLAALFQ